MRTPPDSPEFARFTAAVRKVVTISPEEMQRRLDEHKKLGKRAAKTFVSPDSAASKRLRQMFED